MSGSKKFWLIMLFVLLVFYLDHFVLERWETKEDAINYGLLNLILAILIYLLIDITCILNELFEGRDVPKWSIVHITTIAFISLNKFLDKHIK